MFDLARNLFCTNGTDVVGFVEGTPRKWSTINEASINYKARVKKEKKKTVKQKETKNEVANESMDQTEKEEYETKETYSYLRTGLISEKTFGSYGVTTNNTNNNDIYDKATVVATRHSLLYCPPYNEDEQQQHQQQEEEEEKEENYYLTVRDSGLVSGDVLSFVTINTASPSSFSTASTQISQAYNRLLDNLNISMAMQLHSRLGISGLSSIYNILRDGYGVQAFRVYTAYFERRKENALETLKYFSQGRHVGFVCDRCGETDFKGVRYKCTICHDFDLCNNCQAKIEACEASNCRFKFDHTNQKWIMVKNFNDHQLGHNMIETLPIPNLKS